jgi:hypothetical protein
VSLQCPSFLTSSRLFGAFCVLTSNLLLPRIAIVEVIGEKSESITARKAAIGLIDHLRFCRLLGDVRKLHAIVLPGESKWHVSIVTVEWRPEELSFVISKVHQKRSAACNAISAALRHNLEAIAPILGKRWAELARNRKAKAKQLLRLYPDDLKALGLSDRAEQLPSKETVLVSC